MGNIFCITTIFSFFLYPVFKKCDFFSEITKSVLGVDLFGFFEQTGTLLLGTGTVPAETQLIWRKQPNREDAARARVPLRQSSLTAVLALTLTAPLPCSAHADCSGVSTCDASLSL